MSRRQEPWFWDDGVPYDEYVIACEISNRGAVQAFVKQVTGRDSIIGEMTHSQIIDMVWSYGRAPSKRLRQGPRGYERM